MNSPAPTPLAGGLTAAVAPLDAADRMMLVKLLSKLVGIEDVKRRTNEAVTEAQRSPVKELVARRGKAPIG